MSQIISHNCINTLRSIDYELSKATPPPLNMALELYIVLIFKQSIVLDIIMQNFKCYFLTTLFK